MKRLHLLTIACLVFFLTGCPYHSRHSAGPAAEEELGTFAGPRRFAKMIA